MSQPTNTNLMDTCPGGESVNQYEEATIYTTPNTEKKPNFGDSIPPRGPALSAQQKRAHDLAAHKAENTRFGEAISEHGFGGTTTNFTHSTTTTAHTTGDAAANAGGGGGVGGSGGGGGKEGQTHRHGSYEDVDEEAEETERRERKWQGYGEGSGVGG